MQHAKPVVARSSRLVGTLVCTVSLGAFLSANAASPSIWNGGGTDALWSNPANWNGNVPVPGSAYDLQFGGTLNLAPVNDFASASTFRNIAFNPDAGAFSLGGNSLTLAGGITNNSANVQTFNFPISVAAVRNVVPASGDLIFNGRISGVGGLTLLGTGSVTFGAVNTFTNAFNMNGAIVNAPAGGAINNNGNFIIGNTAGQNASLNVTGGTITNSQATGTGNFMIGRAGFGSLNFKSGIIKANTIYVGWNGGTGTALIDGGSFYCGTGGDYVVIGNGVWPTLGTGSLTVKSGLFSHAGANRTISLNNNGEDRGELNVLGGTLDNSGTAISFGYNTPLQTIGTGQGIVSLNGGNLILNRFINQKQSYTGPGDTGGAFLSFNGGTVTLSPSVLTTPGLSFSSNFIPAQVLAYVNAGGAIIDTAGENAVVDSPLLAPTGGGVTALSIVSGGSGYSGAPYVQIFGGNNAATAIANMIDDGTGRGTFKVDSITVCNPGVNYDSGTSFALVGGNPAIAAVPGVATVAANVSGGLTKIGAGTLTLKGANTYTGNTVVNAGRLLVSSAHAGGGIFVVADGAAFGVIRDAGVVDMAASSLTLGSALGAKLDFVMPDGVPSEQLITVGTLTLNGTTTVDVSGGEFPAGSQFTLIKYNTLVGSPASITSGILHAPDGTSAQIIHNAANKSFDLKVISVAKHLTWSGTVNSGGVGVWDDAITANWLNASSQASLFLQGAEVTFNDSAAGVTSVSVSGTVAPSSMTVDNSSKNYTITGTGTIAGDFSLVKSGTAKLTLNNANTYSGATVVNSGTLAIGGSLSNNASVVVEGGTLTTSGAIQTGAGTWAAGNTDFNRGVININAGSDIRMSGSFLVGTNLTGSAAVNMTGGSLTNTQPSNASNFEIGYQGYGAFNMTGGILDVNTFYICGNSGVGVGNISGGLINAGKVGAADYLLIGASTGTGVLTVNGGVLNHAGVNRLISVNNSGDARGELNLLSGVIDNSGGGVGYGYNAGTGTGTGIVNVNGGNLILNRFVNTKQGGTLATGNAYLNLNGGKLTASPSTLGSPNLSFSSNFIPARMEVRLNGPFGGFAGGVTIDTAGQNVIVDTPLLAPTGNGISSLSLSDGGSGYIGAPYVSIIGDGTGATAIANMISDGNGGLKVGSITVCNPGVNYSAGATYFTFTGGAPSVSATAGAVSTAPNTSGGLTKIGSGILTLLSDNTYTGATIVNDGTLRVNGSLASGSAVSVSGGALAGSGSINGAVNIQSGGTIAPGGTLNLNSTLTLAASSITSMRVNANGGTADLVQAAGNVNYGGTLVISNTAGTLSVGQIFQLFNAPNHNGNFAAVQSADGSVTWTFDPATGIATVQSIAPVETNIGFTFSGSTLSLSWPASQLGWIMQSNSINIGDANAWFDIAGSETGTNLNISVNSGATNVFYRLRQP